MHQPILFLISSVFPQFMSTQDFNNNNCLKIRAILFDLHHTITKTRIGMLDITREAAKTAGIPLDKISDDTLRQAIQKIDERMNEYQIENNVDIHWGGEPEHWLEVNRLLIEYLDITGVDDEMLLNLERAWKHIQATSWESLVDGAKQTLEVLRKRGYVLGICTRRHDDPEKLLKEWKIHHLFSTIHFTGVPGYAKPSPFTLLKAMEDIKINPRLCAYVGNYVNVDVAAAKKAEMVPILTTWANPEERELADADTLIVDKIDELLNLFPGPSNS